MAKPIFLAVHVPPKIKTAIKQKAKANLANVLKIGLLVLIFLTALTVSTQMILGSVISTNLLKGMWLDTLCFFKAKKYSSV
ncbi:MAG: hypothetical protein COX39_01550 [Candidatus Nealsonbacteria bacterium CG23_combo_of_CG06-09_8_20_14_all_40_13]|uniref:Uncharacterized protein n=1 Tax=Candidatus Nealsonbacteria bacterium CG23_combo_of_CG06-09_8_20_14_all_40_13 TaxID=1974724 RepID=A0A2G9YQZ9_9BACT|nr:MAG: hypothetical protein COX39_01550 [Candidatus Nealsonbacteria bacterium CG23_combo_of_CG06-09_8_20_14_all_40_13]